MWPLRTVLLLCIGLGTLPYPSAIAQEQADALAQLDVLQSKLADVADEVRPSVVAIRADRRSNVDDNSGGEDDDEMPNDDVHRDRRRYPAVGTGIVLTAEGLILTNEHVIHMAEPEDIECTLHDGQTYTVQGITSDPRSDLAVLRIDARNLKPARMGDLSTVRQGHFAIVMGNPFGSASENYGKPAMTFGIVSALEQDLTSKLDLSLQHYYGNLIQTDARINPGNSGGPLLNIEGEVIGVTTAISTRSGSSEGVGYAISIDQRTKDIIAQLMRGEEVEYGLIGVKLERPTEEERRAAGGSPTGGAVVREVELGLPASGNLMKGDIVTEFAKHPIRDVDQLIRLVGSAPVGKDVELKVYRDGKFLSVSLRPTRRPVLKGVHREAAFAWRGMKLAEPSSDIRASFNLPETIIGVVVTHVESNTAAEKAGLKPGHVIRQVNDEPVKGLRRLRELANKLTGPLKVHIAEPELEIVLP